MAKFKYFKKAGLNIDGDITLSSQEFRLLSLIDENKEIGLIARESGMDLDDFKRHISKFYKMGLIIPVVKQIIRRYSPDFLQELIVILTYHVGPIATIIMADILSDMNIRDKQIPEEDLGKLLFKITDEISDINQKIEFNNEVKNRLLRT